MGPAVSTALAPLLLLLLLLPPLLLLLLLLLRGRGFHTHFAMPSHSDVKSP